MDESSFRRKVAIFFRAFGGFDDMEDQGKEEPQNLHGN
jgi:hypothetical protein